MAFTQPYTIKYSDSPNVVLQFLHEVIQTPLENEKEWLQNTDGFYSPHKNGDFCELIFFNAGSRDIRMGSNKTEVYSTGDILVVRPDEEHYSRSHDCILDRYHIHISPNAFTALKNQGQDIMGIFFNREKYSNNKISLSPEEQLYIQKLLMSLDHTVRFGNVGTRDVESYALVIRILSLLNNHSGSIPNQKAEKNEILLNMLSYIEHSYPDSDVMHNLAVHFDISRSSLWRLFKTELHTTPYEYLQRVRLKNAKLILEQGSDVTSTSTQCGFSDCSHFIKKFKEMYGITPLKYKKQVYG